MNMSKSTAAGLETKRGRDFNMDWSTSEDLLIHAWGMMYDIGVETDEFVGTISLPWLEEPA